MVVVGVLRGGWDRIRETREDVKVGQVRRTDAESHSKSKEGDYLIAPRTRERKPPDPWHRLD